MGSNLPNVYFFVTILQFICCCVVTVAVDGKLRGRRRRSCPGVGLGSGFLHPANPGRSKKKRKPRPAPPPVFLFSELNAVVYELYRKEKKYRGGVYPSYVHYFSATYVPILKKKCWKSSLCK